MSYEDMHMEAVSKTDEERAFITKAIKKNEIFEQYAPPAGAARAQRAQRAHACITTVTFTGALQGTHSRGFCGGCRLSHAQSDG